MYTLHGTSEQPVEKCFLLGESGGSISQLTSQNKELLQQKHSLFNNIKSRELWFPGHVKHGNGVDASINTRARIKHFPFPCSGAYARVPLRYVKTNTV